MKNSFLKIGLGICWYLGVLSANAQDSIPKYKIKRLFEVGVSANAYKGDLNSNYALWSNALHLGLKFYKRKRWNGHLNLAIGSVRGQNYDYFFSEKATPNIYFRTDFVSFNFDLHYNIIKTTRWNVYLSQGIGLMRFAPKNEENASLQDILTSRAKNELYNNISFIFPTQLGMMYFFNNFYGVGYEVGFFNPQTDYLDNISQWSKETTKDQVFVMKFSIAVPLVRKQKFILDTNEREKSR